jgi:AraC-like DNA-binding protein
MLRTLRALPVASTVWLTPDLGLGFHHFDYLARQYDGLAHTHGEYCLVACLSGEIEIDLPPSGQELLREGELAVVHPGDVHRCRFGRGGLSSSGLTLIVRPSILRSVTESMSLRIEGLRRDLRLQGKQQNAEAFQLIHKLIGEFHAQRPGFGSMVEMLLRQILIHLVRDWPVDRIQPADVHLPPQLPWLHMHRATEFMNSHGKQSFRLTDLCAEVGISPSRFIPLFKNSSGISPHTYYNSLLVFKARHLLQIEGASTKEAARVLGFRNASHFCSVFHQITGSSPQAGGEWSEAVLGRELASCDSGFQLSASTSFWKKSHQ